MATMANCGITNGAGLPVKRGAVTASRSDKTNWLCDTDRVTRNRAIRNRDASQRQATAARMKSDSPSATQYYGVPIVRSQVN